MSSKSRKQTPKTGGKSATKAEARAPVEEHHALEIPDELIDAPEGTSKLRFALMIGLVVLLLLIFAIPSSILSMSGRGSQDDPAAIQWERPGHGTEQLTYRELQTAYRDLDLAAGYCGELLGQLGVTGRKITLQEATRIRLLGTLALDAGVRVPDKQLGTYLRNVVDGPFGGDVELYKQNIASAKANGTDVEAIVRDVMRAHRFLRLAGYAGGFATPAEIEEAWNYQHTEVAFEYIKVSRSEFEDAARSELPEDVELEEWFEALPEPSKNDYMTAERRTAEIVVYRDPESTAAAGLLAAFPPADDVVPEDQAQEYYNRVYFRRFVKAPEESEEPEESEDGDEEEDPLQVVPTEFQSFEEVQDVCLVEAPVYFALSTWLDDLRARAEAGEEIDFIAEAAQHGLELIRVEDVTREELAENDDLSDPTLQNTIFSGSLDDYSFSVFWTDELIGFSRTVARTEPELPPFAEIREEVAEAWVEPRAQELATEHLMTIWEGFEVLEPEVDERSPLAFYLSQLSWRQADAEAFRTAAEAAGQAILERPFLDRGLRSDPAENADDPDRTFFFNRGFLIAFLEEGSMAEPTAGPDGETVYLGRLSATRPVPVEKMSPRELEQFKTQARSASQSALMTGLDLEFLEREYGFVVLLEDLFQDPSESGEDEGESSDGEPSEG